MPKQPAFEPRTFFLNEQHELAAAEAAGGGGSPKFGHIDWEQKGKTISTSLVDAKASIESSTDPLKDRRYFLVAVPARVPKTTTNEKKSSTGEFEEDTNFRGAQSRAFRRLGLDLIDVHDDGTATVHATAARLDQLAATSKALGAEGLREKARWAPIERFGLVGWQYRLDTEWLDSLGASERSDVVFELQPLLTRLEVEEVIAFLALHLRSRRGDGLVARGRDFSGRSWVRGHAEPDQLRSIAEAVFSIQSIHSPLVTQFNASPAKAKPKLQRGDITRRATQLQSPPLPTIAVFDTGIRANHPVLEPYRVGTYRHPDSSAPFLGDHGCFVASRVVFGDIEAPEQLGPGTCAFFDAMVAWADDRIDDKVVLEAGQAVVATQPGVRVFNFSFGDSLPLASYSPIVRRERLILVQDLDNFVFARDILVVVSAGNTPPTQVPNDPYPQHFEDPDWRMGAWPSGMNTLTCGALAGDDNSTALAARRGWPSPFTRTGPGIADAPVPEFAAAGGDVADDWSLRRGFGVLGCSGDGLWEDRPGTSFAAPLLAREAAFAFAQLQGVCAPGARPYGVTVKAFLALTAALPVTPGLPRAVATATVGRGVASARRLTAPASNSAVYVWQGMLDGPGLVSRLQVPIPNNWLSAAKRPELRVVCCWDPPVNAAVEEVWSCRHVTLHFKRGPGAQTLRAKGRSHRSYPLIDRRYELAPQETAGAVDDSPWLIEMSYDVTAEYCPGIEFTPKQRVGLVLELADADEEPVSPQPFIQALPIAPTMVRLSVEPTALPAAIMIRT